MCSVMSHSITETVENQGIDVPTTIRMRRRGESEDAKVFYRRELYYSNC